MMTNHKTILLLTFFITFFNNCSSLFYTNSRENDFPRFGKRFFQLTNPPQTESKEWYHSPSIPDDFRHWKPVTSMNLNAFAWRPFLTSIEVPDHHRNDVYPRIIDEDEEMDTRLQVAKRLVYPSLRDLLIQALRRRDTSLSDIYLSPSN